MKRQPAFSFVQITWALVALVSALLIGGSGWLNLHAQQLLAQRQQASMVQLSEGVSWAVLESVLVRDFGALEARLTQALSNDNVQSAVVTDLRGNVLSNVVRDAITGRPVANFSRQHITPPSDMSSGPTLEMDAEGHWWSWQSLRAAKPAGWLRLQVADPTQQSLRAWANQALTLAVLISGLMVLAVAWVLRRASSAMQGDAMRLQTENTYLNDKALHDSLTGLPNREALLQKLQDSMARAGSVAAGSLAVCFIDLDRFKPINDEYGHDVGDRVLQAMVSRIRSVVRQGDFLARLGGDEFVLVVHGLVNTWEIEPVLSRLLHITTTPFLVEGHSAHLSFSVGVTMYPQDTSDAQTLISHADQAMYKAKRTGGGGWALWQLEGA